MSDDMDKVGQKVFKWRTLFALVLVPFIKAWDWMSGK